MPMQNSRCKYLQRRKLLQRRKFLQRRKYLQRCKYLQRRKYLQRCTSQQAEQINRSLRSLAVVLAFSSFDHYMKILELYFVYKNVKTRQCFNKQ